MLILTRKCEEIIQIRTPENHIINLMITDIRKGQVKVGIDAPAYYAILREELLPDQADCV